VVRCIGGNACCGEDPDISVTGHALEMDQNPRKCVVEFHLGGGRYHQDPVTAKLKVKRMVTVIGGKADQGEGIQVKLRGGSRRLQRVV